MSATPDPLAIPAFNVARELEAGAHWLRTRLQRTGRQRLVVGLSGGIDSAVTSMWAARALGNEGLILVAMPYGLLARGSYAPSAHDSLAHARLIIPQLPGVDYRELDIAATVDAEAALVGLAAELRRASGDLQPQAALANIKARIRAVTLRYFANRFDALLLGTENKTEHYLGYFTIGGDEESDLELLGNYLKGEVRQLALALGVPSVIVQKPPSADLWTGQTDEGELGFTYREADHVLYATRCSTEVTADAAARCLADADVVDRVLSRVRATEFKRVGKPVFSRPDHAS